MGTESSAIWLLVISSPQPESVRTNIAAMAVNIMIVLFISHPLLDRVILIGPGIAVFFIYIKEHLQACQSFLLEDV